MDKNYYEILEIDKNASPEIIKKAYITLAKKYHPDLQEANLKLKYEEKLKLINEAYEVLSNQEKRKQYDLKLLSSCSDNQYGTDISATYNKKSSEEKSSNCEVNTNNEKLKYEKEFQKAIEKAYYDAYIQNLKDRGYKIKYKKGIKEYSRIVLFFFIMAITIFIIFQIPFVKNFFIRLYNENSGIHLLTDFFSNLFNSFFN